MLAHRPDDAVYLLELDRAFLASGHDLSPLSMPVETFSGGSKLFRLGDTPFVGGLPGLIADSLPDAWGNRMLQLEMPAIRTPIGKLAVIGQRGPGALTFEPVLGAGTDAETAPAVLAELAKAADKLRASPVPLTEEHVNEALAKGGSSLGGAQPKSSVHLRLDGEQIERHEILIGGLPPPGYSPCVLKFAQATDEAEGAVEFAFWLMARNAGIRLPRACLVHDGERHHFAVERFDRYRRPDDTIGRRHVHSLSGMMHRKAADGAIDYEDFMRLSRRLGGAPDAIECFRRAVFNLLATNRDDHGRNHLFRYDETSRSWSLAPAFDVTPSVYNTLAGLSWLGSMVIPTKYETLMQLAKIGGIPARNAREIYDQVESATLGGWRRAAGESGVPEAMITYWEKEMFQQTRALRDDARLQTKPVAKGRGLN
ncbi:putative DNA-binding transcriptional regulator [Lacunisphaera limnophila]|uniref:Putative DNA-binding transcriptional regulator n=2 Tax=Lacunisphaera limnophila TaxID=1838286 RepID=A0A1D8AU02_9BACT|nr:putative DNA-binding transcriptional regulator [Lacunisphaera limnophila]